MRVIWIMKLREGQYKVHSNDCQPSQPAYGTTARLTIEAWNKLNPLFKNQKDIEVQFIR